jgi:hypothetical protein
MVVVLEADPVSLSLDQQALVGRVTRLLGDRGHVRHDTRWLVAWAEGWGADPEIVTSYPLARGQVCWWVANVRELTPEELATHQLTQAGGL